MIRQGCVLFFSGLFNLDSDLILSTVKDLCVGFIFSEHINNLCYANETLLVAESDIKLREILDKLTKESKNTKLLIVRYNEHFSARVKHKLPIREVNILRNKKKMDARLLCNNAEQSLHGGRHLTNAKNTVNEIYE